MDKSDEIDNMFYIGDKESPKAKEFLGYIQGYAAKIKAIGGSSIADSEMKKSKKDLQQNQYILKKLVQNYHG